MKKKEVIWILVICFVIGIISCLITIGIYEKKMQKFSSSINQNITKEDDSITVTKEMTVSGVSSTDSISSALIKTFDSFNFVTSIIRKPPS